MKRGCAEASGARLFWYVNGSLEGEELAAARAHVESCAACAREVDLLLAVSRGLEAHEVPLLGEEPGRRASGWPWRSLRFAYGLAASLAGVAVLAVAWSALRPQDPPPGRKGATPADSAGAPRAAAGALAILDLGGGVRRSDGAAAAFAVPAGVEGAALAFSVPPDPEASYGIQLHGPAGPLLDEQAGALPLDVTGRCLYAVPARLLEAPGAYELVVIERSRESGSRVFRFPFRLETSAGRGRR